ncbi:MAG TPA: hypothetical protein VF260_05215 [Bacilli bacterium]
MDVPTKHSGLGIASFVIAMICIALFVGIILFMAGNSGELISLAEERGFDLEADELPASVLSYMIYIGLLFLLELLLSLTGGILGVVGLFQKDRKKLFAVLGTVFNFGGWAIFILLMILGAVTTQVYSVSA